MKPPSKRTSLGLLGASAALLVALATHEGYTDRAVVPTKGDRPTVGFGSTFRDDGKPVQMGDTITPVQALQRTLTHLQKDEAGIKRCVTAPLYQAEYDLMVDFAYQYGVPTLCKSSIVSRANAGDYAGSCEAYLMYRFADRYDCSTPGNRRCWGVWERQKKRYDACMAAQGDAT